MVPASAQEQELLYVGNNHGGTVSVISVPDYEVIGEFDALPDIADRQTWPAAEHVDDLAAPESGEVLYLSRPRTRDLAAFSTETEELLWRLPVPGVPDHMALSMDGKILYLAISNEYMVVVINLEKREIIGQIPTGPQPHCVHLSPDGSRIAYLGDHSGEYELYVRAQDGSGEEERLTTDGDTWRFPPEWSPDNTKLAFGDTRQRLRYADLETHKVVDVDTPCCNTRSNQEGDFTRFKIGQYLCANDLASTAMN